MALPGGAGEDGPFLSIVLVDTCGLLWSAHGIEDDVTCSATGREPLQLSLVIEAVILFLNSQVQCCYLLCVRNV